MKGPGTVTLIGSLQGSIASNVVADVLHALGKAKPRVAVSYAAVAGSADAIPVLDRRIKRLFEGSDATIERFVLDGEPDATFDELARAKGIVDAADIVFLSSGDPVTGARIFAEAGADAWLREARRRGAACIGASAGAILLGAWWAAWPDDEENHDAEPFEGGELVRCTAVVPDLVVDCHDEEGEWTELRIVAAMLAEQDEHPRLRGIPSAGALVVSSEGALEVVGDEPLRLEAV